MRKMGWVAGALACWAVTGTGRAEDTAPVGIGACDNFLAAYTQCVNSAGVPNEARAAIRSGIDSLRTSFRDAAAPGSAARESIRQQCVSSHDQVRARMIEAFKCDFPAASAMPAVADAPVPAAPAPARAAAPTADPAADVARKANAYTKVQNDIVETRPIAKELAEHIRNNERVLKLGTKLGANAWYLYGISDFDRQVSDLKEAMALPGSIPEVDGKAAALVEAMEAVNPVIKELDRYQKTRDFKEDGFKLAREREKPLEDGLRRTIAANEAFSTALFDRRMQIDEKRLANLPAGSLAQGMLGTSLKARVLIRRYDAMEKPADVPAFLAALDDMRGANKTLATTAAGLSPKANSYCADYSEALDALVGHGRDLAAAVKAKQSMENPSAAFARDYNQSVDYYSKCLRDEARARG